MDGQDHQVDIGILGGTGLYEIEGLKNIQEVPLSTPFGEPSEINYRANIYGFKMLGADRVVSVSAVGSLKEEIEPQDIVFADQFFDRTNRRNTFFGEGIAAHISFADPICPDLSDILYKAGTQLGLRVRKGGTYICIDGPAFSARAESNIYRSWGCDIIGMTSATEAKLCREAEICYATMNLVSDYDVWHLEEEPVSVEIILENLRQNIHNAKAIIKQALSALLAERGPQCSCGIAMKDIIVTKPELIPEEAKERLRLIIQKYIKS